MMTASTSAPDIATTTAPRIYTTGIPGVTIAPDTGMPTVSADAANPADAVTGCMPDAEDPSSFTADCLEIPDDAALGTVTIGMPGIDVIKVGHFLNCSDVPWIIQHLRENYPDCHDVQFMPN